MTLRSSAKSVRKPSRLRLFCVDAIIRLGNLKSSTPDAVVRTLRKAVDAGKQDIGDSTIKACRGRFLRLSGGRPLYFAMAKLAIELTARGTHRSLREAVKLIHELDDMQPMFPSPCDCFGYLISCLLALNEYEAARRQIIRFTGTAWPEWFWGKAILAFVVQDRDTAMRILQQAIERNSHVISMLRDVFQPQYKRPQPNLLREMYRRSEAIQCVEVLRPALLRHPDFIPWAERASRAKPVT